MYTNRREAAAEAGSPAKALQWSRCEKMVSMAGRMEMETDRSEQRQNPRRKSVPGPQKSSVIAGTTTPQWAQEGIQIFYSPF